MKSFRKIAGITGAGYLIIFISGIFANFFVLQGLVEPDNAAATMHNIETGQALFRTGILSFIFMVVCDVLLAWTLYQLLRPVNKDLSLLSAWLRLVNGTIFGIALFNLFKVLQMVNGAHYRTLLTADQLHAQVMLSLGSFNDTWLIGLIFFGLHLFVLGYLILRSGYVPKLLGILLIIAGAGYLVDSFAHFLLPDYAAYETVFALVVVVPGVIGELAFTLWLLARALFFKRDPLLNPA